jgi:SAM-dependent methyltransferase
MSHTKQLSDNPATRWNGHAGRAWVEAQGLLEQLFKPLEDLLSQQISTGSGMRLLDVGCGTGSTTIAAARRLGTSGQCVGIDISEPMITAARIRAERDGVPASFLLADAQTHHFAPESFDMIISRFGVMFFEDFVKAFTNLRHAAMDGASLRFVAWRSVADNPFMTTAERAAAPLLPNLPVRQADAPGQFAFADDRRVRRILEESGWSAIDIRPVDVACSMPEKELIRYFTQLGPVGLALQDADDLTRKRVIETVRAAFNRYVNGDDVRFTAACWIVCAEAQQAPVPPK